MIRPDRLSRDLQLEPVRDRLGWRLSYTWWRLENCRTAGEGWDKISAPSTHAMFYPTREAAQAALDTLSAAGALPPMEEPEYGPI